MFLQAISKPELDPSSILNVPDWSHDLEPLEAWVKRKRDSYLEAITWINRTRSELLKSADLKIIHPGDVLSTCKLLIYEPQENVEDASEAASIGFYDICDAPPWDTWFLFADDLVFCCVPNFAISRAQDGIDANAVDCIHWAEWSRLARIEE